MPHGNNRAAAHPRASFQTAGGTIIKFRHPFLSGQISDASPVDEIDVSRALRLNDTFLDAQPMQDHSIMEVLVDGSVVTITNHSLAGSMTLQVLSTTGLVGTGDFIAVLHLIIASKDTTGGTLTVIRTVNEKRLVTIFYGVSSKNVPHLRIAGNSVIPYPVVLNYAGWVQGVSANLEINAKTIWAVGNKVGLKSVYRPYAIQEAENMANFYGGSPLSESVTGVGVNNSDSESGDLPGSAKMPAPLADGMSGTPTPEEVTWVP
jgi:hypothetical protein